MKKIDLSIYANADNSNGGISREWAACRYFGIERNSHDHINYMEGTDIELPNGMNISVKSRDFTLMAGSLCKGCKTFEGIWRRYYKNCHSNYWLFVTEDWQGYLMDKKEFSRFVHRFAKLAHESESKGGGIKIRSRKESRYTRAWLEANCA